MSTTDRAPTGPIRGIIAGSLATGAATAAVLTLVVFGGAPEPVITGAALLGFALGWAILAVLSARLTDQPQSWAWVPAAGLGATGLGLLALTPHDRAITLSGWVWPPLLLSLAIWMGVRIRRSLAAGGGRWLLYPVAAIVAVAGVGGMVETVGLALDQRSHAMPGQSHDVGGYRLHLTCTGSGGPTVVLQSGLGEMSANWARIVPEVSRRTRVCAYDRAGQGWSEDAPHLQDGVQAAADLHTLLRRAGENGPYVLVGHSIGGNHAMTYAARFPEQVAGMVLLDATDPYRSADTGSAHAGLPGAVALAPSLARLGVGRLLPTSFWSTLPEPAAGQVQAFVASARGWRNTCDEIASMPALLDQARALTALGSTPLVVLTAADPDPSWSAAQDRMAALSTNNSHRVADATHAGLLEEERGAEESARAIADVIDAARNGSPLAGA
ncbi:Pimeloyl-ACP methyl ester carboxylesterase [Geodermatophilus siccatus]|uniref:Pimeloyl-ACP methyl ester carboxylesterase n=1 Tax=Geodermatophilus siccatus TaxID=1137991 RepID=A0A1H0ADH8_9ACTN|nr:alpha/beta hydrolase [Geodermatophilus siccatus]SDN31535.1 Pimeloyl-ACP methyl ester carboxylesterase [Geodermatophilus siccatus]